MKPGRILFMRAPVRGCGRYGTGCAHLAGGRIQTGLFLQQLDASHPTFFVRRALYEQYGLFDPALRFSADYELMLRSFPAPAVGVLPARSHRPDEGRRSKQCQSQKQTSGQPGRSPGL